MDPDFTEDAHEMLTEAAGDIAVVVSILSNASGIYESLRSKSVLGINAVTVINYATGGVVGPTLQLFMYHLKFWNEPLELLSTALTQADKDLAQLKKQIVSVKEGKSISVAESDNNIQALLALDKQFVSFIKASVEQQNSLRELSRKISDLSASTGLTFIKTGSELVDQLSFYIGNIITSISAYQRPMGDILESLAQIPQQLEKQTREMLLTMVDERQAQTESLSEVLVRISAVVQTRGFPICRGKFSGVLRSFAEVKKALAVCREKNIDACFKSLTERETLLASLKREQFIEYADCSIERVSLEDSLKEDYSRNVKVIVSNSDDFLTTENLNRYGQAIDSVLEKPDVEGSKILYWVLFTVVFIFVFAFFRKWSEGVDKI